MDLTVDQPLALRAMPATREYAFTMKRLAWMTLAVTAVMGGLYFLIGFPPAFDTYFEKMYFHAIGIGIAALAAYLVLNAFDLEKYEPALDFPIRYRAFIAVVFGALGGLVFLSPNVFASLPDIGVMFMLVAFVLIFDVSAALLVELIALPRKKAGVYDSRSHNIVDYVGRLVPFKPADRAAYAGVGSAYWLAVASIASACVAMLIGFMNLWVRMFGPSIFGGFMAWLGLDTNGLYGATLDPHSHMVALAIIGLVVAVVAVQFGVFDGASTLRRAVARAGTWIAIIGVIGTTLVLGAVTLLNFAPPTLFTSGPDGVNGMAGDDMVMTIVFIGAIVVAAAVVMDPRHRRNGLRLTIIGTWVATVAITVLEGFYIELNQVQFGGGGSLAANDASFAAAHPMTGIFLMIVLSLALLLVDAFGITGQARRVVTAVGAIGLVAAAAGTTFWTFVDPTNSGPAFALLVVGIAISYVAVLVAAIAVRAVQTRGPERTTS